MDDFPCKSLPSSSDLVCLCVKAHLMCIISRANLRSMNFYFLLLMTNDDADLNIQKKMGVHSLLSHAIFKNKKTKSESERINRFL